MYTSQLISAHTTLIYLTRLKSSILKFMSSMRHLCQNIQMRHFQFNPCDLCCSSQSSTSSSKLSHTHTMMIHKVVGHFAFRAHTQVSPVTGKCQVQLFLRNLTRGTFNRFTGGECLYVFTVELFKTKLMVTAERHAVSHMISSRPVASCQGTNIHYKEDW